MVNFGYPYNDIVICKDSTDYLGICYPISGHLCLEHWYLLSYIRSPLSGTLVSVILYQVTSVWDIGICYPVSGHLCLEHWYLLSYIRSPLSGTLVSVILHQVTSVWNIGICYPTSGHLCLEHWYLLSYIRSPLSGTLVSVILYQVTSVRDIGICYPTSGHLCPGHWYLLSCIRSPLSGTLVSVTLHQVTSVWDIGICYPASGHLCSISISSSHVYTFVVIIKLPWFFHFMKHSHLFTLLISSCCDPTVTWVKPILINVTHHNATIHTKYLYAGQFIAILIDRVIKIEQALVKNQKQLLAQDSKPLIDVVHKSLHMPTGVIDSLGSTPCRSMQCSASTGQQFTDFPIDWFP